VGDVGEVRSWVREEVVSSWDGCWFLVEDIVGRCKVTILVNCV
jgi:hypothetical protein